MPFDKRWETVAVFAGVAAIVLGAAGRVVAVVPGFWAEVRVDHRPPSDSTIA